MIGDREADLYALFCTEMGTQYTSSPALNTTGICGVYKKLFTKISGTDPKGSLIISVKKTLQRRIHKVDLTVRFTNTGPDGQSHHHIFVENGRVVRVEYISGDGYWDRELEKSEYFVKYKDEWLTPKLYHGKSMCELGECDCGSNPECICCK